ncbi:MAG: hypothetical protein LBT00_01305 [Spirochaetaceae bacterium]|jgi:hypothetical protein|nr:hypothetical protein [Spirochaetaceae bacterium]
MDEKLLLLASAIFDFFKNKWKNSWSSNSGKTATNGNAPASDTGNATATNKGVVFGGNPTVNNTYNNTYNFSSNITINMIKADTASSQFSRGIENKIIAKDEESGFYLAIHRDPKKSEYLAIGFFAYCSFGDKKNLPIWVGFQPQEHFTDNTSENMTFSIELLSRQTWLKADFTHTKLEECGYKGKGKDDGKDAAYYKFFNGLTLETDAEVLYERVRDELQNIGERLS